MTKKDSHDWFFIALVLAVAVFSAIIIGIAIDDHSNIYERSSVDSLSADSVHFYEDGL